MRSSLVCLLCALVLFGCAGNKYTVHLGGGAGVYSEQYKTTLNDFLSDQGTTASFVEGDKNKVEVSSTLFRIGTTEELPSKFTTRLDVVLGSLASQTFTISSNSAIKTKIDVALFGLDAAFGYPVLSWFRPELGYRWVQANSSVNGVTVGSSQMFVGPSVVFLLPLGKSTHINVGLQYQAVILKEEGLKSSSFADGFLSLGFDI